jgi:transcriptional regulator GlxA family with amidase domain
MKDTAPKQFRIGILAYEGCFAAEIYALSDLLLVANRIATQTGVADDDRFRITVVAASNAPVGVAGGSTIGAKRWHHRLDLLVVPGFELVPGENLDDRLGRLLLEANYIESLASRGVPVASICVGAFLLGESGLLDGRRATTAWLFADELARRYPSADVRSSSLVEEDRGVVTMAAFSASQDLALRVIRDRLGPQIARATARITLVAEHRQSQAPFIDRSLAPTAASPFSEQIERWLVDRISDPYCLAELAAAFNVSTRTMLRRYRNEAGMTPLDFLQRARIDHAKRLLEESHDSLSKITGSVGYRDPGTFRRLFIDEVGISPADYRNQFRSRRQAGVLQV